VGSADSESSSEAGGVSNVDIAGKNTLQIKAIGVTISTFETLPDRCIWLARFRSETVRPKERDMSLRDAIHNLISWINRVTLSEGDV